MNLDSIDFLGIAKHFSDEEIMVQRTAKEFASKEIMPIIEDCFEKNIFPEDLIPKFAELGFLGVNLPEKYGCGGMSNVAYGLICQELEKVDEEQISISEIKHKYEDILERLFGDLFRDHNVIRWY